MPYIGYSDVEALLRDYRSLKSLLYNHQIELQRIWRDPQNSDINENDILYSLTIGNKVLSDMPHITRSPGDKEISIIDRKDKMIQGEIRDKIQTINTIGEVIEKLESAMRSLSLEKQAIITDFYFEGWTWGEIAGKMASERDALRDRRKDAIRQIVSIIRVTKEQFAFCVNKLEEGRERDRQTNS